MSWKIDFKVCLTQMSGQNKYKKYRLNLINIKLLAIKVCVRPSKTETERDCSVFIAPPSHSTLCIFALSNANLNCFQSIIFYINFYVYFHL